MIWIGKFLDIVIPWIPSADSFSQTVYVVSYSEQWIKFNCFHSIAELTGADSHVQKLIKRKRSTLLLKLVNSSYTDENEH